MMWDSLEQKFMTPDHYKAFGRIVQAFVSVETVYSHIIMRTLKVEDGAGMFMLSGYGYDGLKNIIKSMISEGNLSEAEAKEVLDLMDKVNDKSNLRNNVAHCPWKPGRRPNSVKPLVLKTKGTLKILGIEHNEKDWTPPELEAEAGEILKRCLAVAQFFADRGVVLGNTEEHDD